MTVNPQESDTNGLSSGKTGSDLSVGLLGFVVNTTVTMEEAFSRVVPLSPASTNPSMLLIHVSSIYHRRYIITDSITQLK
jgi:hypothetical protein